MAGEVRALLLRCEEETRLGRRSHIHRPLRTAQVGVPKARRVRSGSRPESLPFSDPRRDMAGEVRAEVKPCDDVVMRRRDSTRSSESHTPPVADGAGRRPKGKKGKNPISDPRRDMTGEVRAEVKPCDDVVGDIIWLPVGFLGRRSHIHRPLRTAQVGVPKARRARIRPAAR
jgi:hypothetical protein